MKYVLFVLSSVLTGGITVLVAVLSPKFKRLCTLSQCSPEDATDFTVLDENGNLVVGIVNRSQITSSHNIIILEINCQRYYLECASGGQQYTHHVLKKVESIPADFKKQFVLARGTDNPLLRKTLEAYYGPNAMKLPEANFFEILAKQIFHPFYVFQYFAVAVWLSADYVLYSMVILLITGGAVYLTTREQVFNLRRLRDLAGKDEVIKLLVAGDREKSGADTFSVEPVLTSSLIPGDRVIITDEMCMPCDVLLLQGRAVLDESMLTGESVPVTKQSYDPSEKTAIDPARNASNVMFSGTKVLSASGATVRDTDGAGECTGTSRHGDGHIKCCIGVVFRTGFRSAKGQLVASLLNPKKEFLAFFSDALWVILFMFILTVFLYLWTLQYLIRLRIDVGTMILKFLDAITIAVPPALTASLTVATAVCVDRLRVCDIFVSDTAKLNWAGLVNAVCFDKTGTLTEERLDFCGVSLYSEKAKKSIEHRATEGLVPLPALEVMATCHGLSLMNGNFVGDPLEKELVRASGWTLSIGESGLMHATVPVPVSDPSASPRKYSILRHFDFSPEKLRAASLIRRPNGELAYLAKGSPEAIMRLSKTESIPSDLSAQLTSLGRRGYRVIAMASRTCRESQPDLLGCSQEQIEAADGGLVFMGLAFLSSRLKADTKSTIECLHRADIYANMITGDHVFTAVAVGRECGLVVDSKRLFIIDLNPVTSELQILTSDGKAAIMSDVFCVPNDGLDVEAMAELPVGSLLQHLAQQNDEYAELQLAITGQGLHRLRDVNSAYVPVLVRSCQVFARMKPKDKKMIVEQLMVGTYRGRRGGGGGGEGGSRIDESESACSVFSMDTSGALLSRHGSGVQETAPCRAYKVMFCGDGANDMAALKASTVGVSLCDAETSVAAPVTSRLQTPGAVVDVIREGRASLVTAYVLVNFNIMYGVIQLFMTCQLYSFGLKVGNYMYLIQDLLYTLVLGIAITMTPALTNLSTELPPERFFTRHLVVKLFSQLICFPLFQMLTLMALGRESWYTPYKVDGDPLSVTYSFEASALSSIALAQLMIASVAATIDQPFRTEWYKNGYHVFALALQALFLAYQIFSRASRFNYHILEVEPLPFHFCGILVGIIFCNCVVSGILARIADMLK